MAGPSPSPVPSAEEAWEEASLAAAEAYAAGQTMAASTLWTDAAGIAETFANGDPRRAAALNNLGLAANLTQSPTAADDYFDAAVEAWRQAPAWLAAAQLQSPARSSLFHMRLEQRHGQAFGKQIRQRLTVMLEGAAAVTDFNLIVLQPRAGWGPNGFAAISDALARRAKAFGPRNPELLPMLAALLDNGEDCVPLPCREEHRRQQENIVADPARGALQRWRDEKPADQGDTRRLWAAVTLTQVGGQRTPAE